MRVVSTGEREPFKKPSGKDTQFVPLLQALGEIPSGEEPLLEVIKEETKDFLGPIGWRCGTSLGMAAERLIGCLLRHELVGEL